jgi:hypothetical protein
VLVPRKVSRWEDVVGNTVAKMVVKLLVAKLVVLVEILVV